MFNFLSNKEKLMLQDVFNQLDENKDGKLSKEEIISGLQKYHFVKQSQEIASNIMKCVDSNHNNYIDFSEWLIATTSKSQILSDEILKKAFAMIDQNGNGYIEISELERCF